jgi:hypothetical protein
MDLNIENLKNKQEIFAVNEQTCHFKTCTDERKISPL